MTNHIHQHERGFDKRKLQEARKCRSSNYHVHHWCITGYAERHGNLPQKGGLAGVPVTTARARRIRDIAAAIPGARLDAASLGAAGMKRAKHR